MASFVEVGSEVNSKVRSRLKRHTEKTNVNQRYLDNTSPMALRGVSKGGVSRGDSLSLKYTSGTKVCIDIRSFDDGLGTIQEAKEVRLKESRRVKEEGRMTGERQGMSSTTQVTRFERCFEGVHEGRRKLRGIAHQKEDGNQEEDVM